jgi:hypothetical protein
MWTLLWPLFAWLPLAQPATVVARTKGEGAVVVTIRSVCVGSHSHCGGGHDRWKRRSALCSHNRVGHRQPLYWWARYLRALLWPLFDLSSWALPDTGVAARKVRGMLCLLFLCSAWAHPGPLVSGTTKEGAALHSVHLVVVGSDRQCVGGHDT